MTPRVAILDYGCGNLGSVVNAVRKVGGEPTLVVAPRGIDAPNRLGLIESFSHVILPGQGAFCQLVENVVRDLECARHLGKPILGICLGMQLMCEGSEEAPGVQGLGWFPWKVERLDAHRLPHVGWNGLGCPDGVSREFYFCHSYAVPANSDTSIWDGLAEVDGCWFRAMVKHNNLWAVQFHPEKSGKAGLNLLAEFLKL